MKKAALFCDETMDYRKPAEPDAGEWVTVKFRTEKDDVDSVYIIFDGHAERVKLEKAESDGWFDYYATAFQVDEEPVFYYFEIADGDEVCHYTRLGVAEDLGKHLMFRITPGFHVPDWAKGAVMYQIFVDRFCNGDKTNDVESDEYVYIGYPVTKVENWEEGLSVMDVDRFYGGDLKGIWDKLDYIEGLGVEVIYLSPIFVSPSNHKYDCQDYSHVDPHYGVIVKDADGLVTDNAADNGGAEKYAVRTTDPANLEASDRFFAEFAAEVHRRGMRLLLDGVFNHCGSFNRWLDRERIYEKNGGYEPGAYVTEESPYRNFFRFRDEKGWPCNGSYEGWWGHDTLPKLNYDEDPKLMEYIMEVGRKWVSAPYFVDGWRLDVAADLGHSAEFNHAFWRQFRENVKAANPDALLLAEHYGDASPWLAGDQWDTVMNYDAFMEPLSWFLTGLEKHSDRSDPHAYQNSQAFFSTMLYNMSRMQTPSLMAAMNEISNHDHSRFLTRTNRTEGRLYSKGHEAASEGINYGIFRAGVVVQMTWPGAPTVYYGDEAGVCGWTDPDNRRTYPWGHEDLELIEFHRYLIGIRKKNKVFRNGSFKPLLAENGMIAYGRFTRERAGVVAVNSTGRCQEAKIAVWEAGVRQETMVRVMETTEKWYNVGKLEFPVTDGILTVKMEPYSAVIFEEKMQ